MTDDPIDMKSVLSAVCAAAVGHPKDRVFEIHMDAETLTVTSLTDTGARTDTIRWTALHEQIASLNEEK